jgi:hemerythrin-like domain-containing protein
MTNFFNLLKEEHKEAKDTFKTLLSQETADRHETQVLCQKLLLHMEMEEKYFYPLMESFKATEELSEEAELEHTEAKKFITALQQDKKLDDTEFKVKLEMLQLAIEHHADEEESELFPKAKAKLSEAQVKEITEKMVALKEKKQKAVAAK